MNLRNQFAAIALALAFFSQSVVPAHAALPAVLDAAPLPSLAPMVKRVSPSVVNIATRGTIKEQQGQRNPLLDDPFFRRFFDVPPDSGPRERQFQSAGSGVIVDSKNGYIITNHHVVENASEITITLLDNRSFTAKVIGTDEGSDIAVLQAKQPNLVAMSLGDSAKLEVGDYVVAIGNPFGLQHTVTAGIVSALGRSGINPEGYEDFIQTDASINPGNSGGALVNLRGELVGINSAILSRSGGNIGIGFAIPVNIMKQQVAMLEKNPGQTLDANSTGTGIPYIGVALQGLDDNVRAQINYAGKTGVVVSGVYQGTPADKAGLQAGDVITSIDGKAVNSPDELTKAIHNLKPGQTVAMQVFSAGIKKLVSVKIGEAPPGFGQPQQQQQDPNAQP